MDHKRLEQPEEERGGELDVRAVIRGGRGREGYQGLEGIIRAKA